MPPVLLVKNVICHVCCRGILVVLYWPSAPPGIVWLKELGGVFKSYAVDFLYMDLYLHRESKISIFGAENLRTPGPVFFLLLDGAV